MGVCQHCGYRGAAVYLSVAARGAMLCLGCYGRLPESRPNLPPGWKPYEPPPPKSPKPWDGVWTYPLMWERVYTRLKSLTDSEVFLTCDGTGRMAAYCPVCKVATIVVQVVSVGPELRTDPCDNGCTAAQIARVLLTRGKT